MASPQNALNDIQVLLQDFQIAANKPAKKRGSKISDLVDQICSRAYDDGLSDECLATLVDIITLPNQLDQSSTGHLIRNLFPTSKVPDVVVIKVVGSLGQGRRKPSYNVQANLLQWLVMVYDVLANPNVLSQLYSLLFNLLDTAATRPQVCHVLSLITRRKHVRPFRIQALMELIRQAGNEAPLIGLLRVYKDYYPDVIVGDTSGRASVFTHPNLEWRSRLGEIQYLHHERLQADKRGFMVARTGRSGIKRSKSTVVPEVHTFQALESSVTLEEIEDVHDFVARLEQIVPPNQLVSVIGDPLLQKYLHLIASESSSRRVDSWMLAYFEDQLESPASSEGNVIDMLHAILEYARYTKSLPPACLTYLESMMPTWNGITGKDVILGLLAYTPIRPFQELYQRILEPLQDAILEPGTVESKETLLKFYGCLLEQWSTLLLCRPTEARGNASSITSLMNHAAKLALTILQICGTMENLATVLEFYESAASLISRPELQQHVRIDIPPGEIVYTLHFRGSLSTISRLCDILALYKKAFEIAMAPKTAENQNADHQSYGKDYVNRFNGFLMDVCNCVWRSRAFNTTDPNALACLLEPGVTQALSKYVASQDTSLSLPNLFSFSYSPVFCLLAISYIRDLEDGTDVEIERRHAGPVTQASLKQLEKDGGLKLAWPDYKLGMLHHMEGKGVKGIGELMYNTMKHLMAGRENKAQP